MLCPPLRMVWYGAVPQTLAFLSWRNFGWRLHSRLGVDFRKKGAEVRRRMYTYQDIYVTIFKLDFM